MCRCLTFAFRQFLYWIKPYSNVNSWWNQGIFMEYFKCAINQLDLHLFSFTEHVIWNVKHQILLISDEYCSNLLSLQANLVSTPILFLITYLNTLHSVFISQQFASLNCTHTHTHTHTRTHARAHAHTHTPDLNHSLFSDDILTSHNIPHHKKSISRAL
jgi:hypothetical protein